MNNRGKPVRFIYEKNGKLAVDDSCLSFLKSLQPPFTVICVAGQFRTGKSCLLNRGILDVEREENGFKTASSVNACTKGLWLYDQIVERNGERFLVFDSEGTRSLSQTADGDSKLIGLSLLLSSVFIFNSTGNIDESALASLAVYASVARSVRGDDESLYEAPELIWTLRDFHLEVQTEDGRSITPDEYLDNILKVPGNEARRLLITEFPNRHLFPFARPVEKDTDFLKFSSLSTSDLAPAFQTQLIEFRKLLEKTSKTKKIAGHAMGGLSFLDSANYYCSRINEGRSPNIKDSYDFMVDNEMLRLGSRIDQELFSTWDRFLKEMPFPPDELKAKISALVENALAQSWTLGGSLDQLAIIVESKKNEWQAKVLEKNDERCVAWSRQEMKHSEKAVDQVLWFKSFLEPSVKRIGADKTVATVGLFVESVMSKLQSSFDDIQSKTSAQNERNEELTIAIELATKQRDVAIADLEMEITKIEKQSLSPELEELREQLTNHVQSISFLEAKLADYQNQGELPKLETSVVTFEDFSALTQKNIEISHLLSEERLEKSSLLSKISELESDHKDEIYKVLIDMKDIHQQAVGRFEAEKNALTSELGRSVNLNEARKTEIDAVHKKLLTETTEAKRLNEYIKKKIFDNETECENLRKEGIDKLKAHAGQTTILIEEQRKELVVVRAKSFEVETRKAQTEGVCENQKRKLEELTTEMNALKRLKTESDSLHKSYIEHHARNRSNDIIISDLTERAHKAEAELRECNKTITILERAQAVQAVKIDILNKTGARSS